MDLTLRLHALRALLLAVLLAAAADEVSVQIAAVFAAHAQGYQTLSAQAATFHDQFVSALTTGAAAYAAAEAANTSPLDAVLGVINAPSQLLLTYKQARPMSRPTPLKAK